MQNIDDRQHDQFLRLFAEHETALRTFVRSLLPSRADASEVMQEVAVVLWQKFESARDFRKWAIGVARYEVLMFLRDKARDRHVFDDDLVRQIADTAEAAALRHDAQREALDACLQKLPETQRELVLAAYSHGARMDELASRRGQTAMSLYKMLHRVRQLLLECVRRTISKEEYS